MWLHFTIFLDPDQLVDKCLTGDMAAAVYFTLYPTHKMLGLEEIHQSAPVFCCCDVDAVLCCVIIVVELNFIH